jgi:hypothetical protein
MMKNERQIHPRKRGRVMVRYGVNGADKTGFSMNISLTGLSVRTNNVFKPGTTLEVELELPRGTYTHWAQVVWAKKVPPELAHVVPCGMGLRFINPGADWEETFASWKSG